MSDHTNFSFSTIADFDGHIASEIRGYDILDDIAKGLADMIMQDGTRVYDLGCSTGRFLKDLATSLAQETDSARKRSIDFIGYEPNDNFKAQHAELPDSVHVINEKITRSTRFKDASLILSIFTLQFIPIPERVEILRNVYNGLCMNGAFIWAEKVYASDSQIETLITRRHLDFKQRTSTPADIMGKDQRLRAIMHPLPLATNLEMLENAGFKKYEVFWRVNNFVGLVAMK